MKKLLFILLFPISVFAQTTDTNLNLEADTIRTETHAGRNTAQRVGRMFKNIIASKSNINGNTGVLAIAGGGTGTTTPALVAGTNISITGSWPNQTINQSGGSGITNSAPNTILMMSDGVNAVTSGIASNGLGSVTMGSGSISGDRTITVSSNTGVAHLLLTPQGSSGAVKVKANSSGGSSASLFLGQDSDVSTSNTLGVNGSGSNISLNIFSKGTGNITLAGGSNLLVLKSTGSLSWTSVTLINGWSNTSNHHFRVTPDDNLEVTFNLNSSSATNSTLGTVSGLTIPTPVSGGFPSSIVFVGNNGAGAFIYIRADITATGITFICPNYASASGAVQVTGSIPLTSAF